MRPRTSTAPAPGGFPACHGTLLKPTTIYVITISIYGGMAMFTESYMLWGGNRSPNNIGTTIVGYLYRKGFEETTWAMATRSALCCWSS